MISASDFRNGITIEKDGSVLEIVEFQHVKPGKGAAFVRTKLKDIINGGVTETTFRPTEKFPQARIDRKEYQYLYQDGELYAFMDTETFDQISLGKDIVGDNMKFVKENDMVKVNSYNNTLFAIEPPCLSSWRSLRPSPASRVTRQPVRPSPRSLRPAHRSAFRCSAISATRSRSIPDPASIFPEHNLFLRECVLLYTDTAQSGGFPEYYL